jgi:hypothetical protein
MALGFAVVGLDLSLYGNDDAARGEVALFMARAVEARTDLSARSTRAP